MRKEEERGRRKKKGQGERMGQMEEVLWGRSGEGLLYNCDH